MDFKTQEGSDAKEFVREWLRRSDGDHRDKLLACGAIIVAELRMQVLRETEFTCSAGIAHNKVGSSQFLKSSLTEQMNFFVISLAMTLLADVGQTCKCYK